MTNIEQEFENCRIAIKQMKQYEPDPYYINYFLYTYINSINKIFNGIFEEAAIDFGLFVSGKITQQIFEEKNQVKNDIKINKFLDWYKLQQKRVDKKSSSKFIKEIIRLNQNKKILKIKIMIKAKQRFLDDIFQEIKIILRNGKLISKDELRLEISKQSPRFLEIINVKRKENREPIVKKNQIIANTFVEIEGKNFEIIYYSEMYLKTITKIVQDSRNKIKELKSN